MSTNENNNNKKSTSYDVDRMIGGRYVGRYTICRRHNTILSTDVARKVEQARMYVVQ